MDNMKPKMHKFWKHGPNCSSGRFRLFVYKSEYNKILKQLEELKFDLSLSELSRKTHKTPSDTPLTIRDALREISKAQRHIEDRYPNSNEAGRAYNVKATVTALRVAHTRLMHFTNNHTHNQSKAL